MVLELAWAQKQTFWLFQNGIFQFFAIFWVTKLKTFSPKVRRNVKKYLKQNLFNGSFLENGFEAILSSKTFLLSVWKRYFSVFCKVETIFWESEREPSTPFKFIIGHRRLCRKWFWNDFEIKNECSEHLERKNFQFVCNFWVTKLKPFSEKEGNCSIIFKSKFYHSKPLK